MSLVHVAQLPNFTLRDSLVEEDEFIYPYTGVVVVSVNIPPSNHHLTITICVVVGGKGRIRACPNSIFEQPDSLSIIGADVG